MKKFRFDLGFWFVIVLTGLVVMAVVLSHKNTSANTTAAPVQNESKTRKVALSCTTDMETQFHIHPELSIVVNGAPVVIPANIGVLPGCMNPIHTHDATGQIHVESPVAMDFTLGDFFAVWGKDFSKDKVLDYTAGNGNVITMTVNGTPVDTFENTILKDKDKIVITYGKQ